VAEQYLKFLIKQKGIGRGTGYFEWIWEEIEDMRGERLPLEEG